MTSRRRVSYVIPPPPSGSVPRLRLPPLGVPRHGQIGPILLYSQRHELVAQQDPTGQKLHPRHRLGVAAFALDTTTQLAGRGTPEGILYTGGRDGMIMAWDLGISLKRRSHRQLIHTSSRLRSRRMGSWERLTRDDEDDNAIYEEEDDDDDWPTSDGDIIGDVRENEKRRGSRHAFKQTDPLHEHQWETNMSLFEPGQPTCWRQGTQAHTDWINDILLCNLNQTVISGSSDGTVKAWNPHNPATQPTTIGTHSDYVRCLAHSPERKWVASGSFDRMIKLWDISSPRKEAMVTLLPPELSGPKFSVYALATDPFGHVIASGGPERVVRTWDPRSGKRIGKLVGHTDNIRAILISEDSRYLLTGSADASIKLWSLLSPQRCIYTFTHHTESIWSLFSTHPSLETFYSGDRSGLVCRVDVEECDKISDGECIVVCRDKGEPNIAASEGVSKIIAMDDNLVWAASGSSSVKRWRVPQGRVARLAAGDRVDSSADLLLSSPPRQDSFNIPKYIVNVDLPTTQRHRGLSTTPSMTASIVSSTSSIVPDVDNENSENMLNGIPYDSLVKLTSPNSHTLHSSFSVSRTREADVATLYSAASIMSVPRQVRSPSSTTFRGHSHTQSLGVQSYSSSLHPGDTLGLPIADGLLHAVPSPRAAYEERDVAPDAKPLNTEPDEVIEGDHGLIRVMVLNDRMHAITVDTTGAVAVWNIVRGLCLGMYTHEDVLNAITSTDGSVSDDSANDVDPEKSSPRQALETVRERIEGEAVVLPWASADTTIGELTIQIMDKCFESEIFADEAGYSSDRQSNDEHRLNIGKWVLRNLFYAFIREEQRSAMRQAHDKPQPSSYKGSQWGLTSSSHLRSTSEALSPRALGQHSLPAASSPDAVNSRTHITGISGLSPIIQSPLGSIGSEETPKPNVQPVIAPPIPDSATSSTDTNATTTVSSPPVSAAPSVSASSGQTTHDYFSLRRRPSMNNAAAGQTTPDDFSGWGGPGSAKHNESGLTTPSTPGGFMGRLRGFGKGSRRAATEVEAPSTSGQAVVDSSHSDNGDGPVTSSPPKTLAQRLKSQPLSPPPSSEAPPLSIPANVSVIISEESASGSTPLYRGTVGNVGVDAAQLEETMPAWLLEFLLTNKAPAAPVTKVSFVLLPAQIPPGMRSEYGDTLPELLNTSQSKLSASRFLRVRKLTYHVQEKLDKVTHPPSSANSGSPRSSSDNTSQAQSMSRGSSSSPSLPMSSHASNSPNNHSPSAQRSSSPTHALPSASGHSTSHNGSASGPSTPRSLLSHQLPDTQLPRAEDTYEILCNEQVLPLDMTLAAVRQFIWRQAGELVMHYRRKPQSRLGH